MKDIQGLFFRDFEADHVVDIMKEIFFQRLYGPYLEDKKDQIIVDLGANVGFFTYYAYPFAKKIYAVEPSAIHVETLTLMLDFNKMNRVQVIPVAIAGQEDIRNFYHSDNTTAYSLTPIGDGKDFEKVSTLTLRKLFEVNDIDHVDFLKMDIEGEEARVLSDFDDVAPKIDKLVVECHAWNGSTPGQVVGMLQDRGFAVRQLPTDAVVFAAWKQ